MSADPQRMTPQRTDSPTGGPGSTDSRALRIIIAGSGIAGLSAALRLASRHRVTLITKGRIGESNTACAQGGIAGVIGTADTVDSHIADTVSAGAGHCDAIAVRTLCEAGGDAILTLAEAGVDFDTDPTGAWARGIEGAHSHPRVFHAGGDATGRAISAALTARLRAEVDRGRIELHEHTMLVDIITDAGAATGVTVLRAGRLAHLDSDAVVLATGGAGQVFAHTTNPEAATGDGLAAAMRAGAQVRDLEFFQFHPTALAGSGFLISKALRGAGALLLDEHGRRFMTAIDDRAELAPRDVVALALHRRTAAQDGRPCFLDARAVPAVAERFPSITAGLAAHGLDPSVDLIPVTPAAHYFMGGVATDLEGRTSLDGLFAIGEVACTGVHGANRLASNSLLEGAVFAVRAANAIDALRPGILPERQIPRPTSPPPVPDLDRAELQALTWTHLGVERTGTGLRSLLGHLGEGRSTSPGVISGEELETANLALIAEHMARHALAREHSLGAHSRTDTPVSSPTALLQEAAAC